MRWYLPIHVLLVLSFLSHLVSRVTICAEASIVDQKLVRKRQGEERTASSLINSVLQKKMIGNEFGRIILEEEMPYYSFSYSYSFSYYPCSFSYPPMSYSLSFLPTQVTTLEPNSDGTAAPSEKATAPSYSPTFWPSEQPSSSITSSVTNTPTPFDVNSNDPGEPVTVSSSSPSAATVTSAPSISATIDQTQIITEVNSNSTTSTTSGIVNQEEEQDTSDDSKTFLIPVVGLAAGAFIVGIAVKAIDRRHRPDAYQNLDEDSQSSFSLP